MSGKSGAEVRILRSIEPDAGDTTRKEDTEQAKLAAKALGGAKFGSLRELFLTYLKGECICVF